MVSALKMVGDLDVAVAVPHSPTMAVDGAQSTLKSAQIILELGEYILSVIELSTLDPR